MKLIEGRAELRSALAAAVSADKGGRRKTVVLVPTMGALHDGHRSLLKAGRGAGEVLVMSLFVNPLQFALGEDLASYPREEAGDLDAAEAAFVDVVFAPRVEDMYGPGDSTLVSAGRLGAIVEGRSRPGHFDGVATVIAKLFNLVKPDIALFGQKDAQQLAVIRRMVRDLAFDVAVEACPTVRASDGLALSSRNSYLSAADRSEAPLLHRALVAGKQTLEAGASVDEAEVGMARFFAGRPRVELDYARVVDPDTFEPPRRGGSILVTAAARFGDTRLIDNLLVGA